MERRIFKYKLMASSLIFVNPTIVELEIPEFATFLSVQMQDNSLVVWASVLPEEKYVKRIFHIVGTGGAEPERPFFYLGTAQDHNLVYHVFYEWEK